VSGWVDAETTSKHNIIVFAGETFSRLVGGYYTAALHQVVANKTPRISMPFILRADHDAWLDADSLGSKVIGPMIGTYKNKENVNEFLQKEMLNRKSVNSLY